MDDIKHMWQCSHAVESPASPKERMFPSDNNIEKTKWKSIVSIEPKSFFERYLTQYPGDTRAIQPVVLFSHKPLFNSSLDHIADVCKVIDVAVVPDTPGVCVAVTETFHDVASYHMLHADKQPDGSFSLTANSLEGRELPNEEQYTQARALLLSYFDNVDMVANAVKAAPKYGNLITLCILSSNQPKNVYSKVINHIVSTFSLFILISPSYVMMICYRT